MREVKEKNGWILCNKCKTVHIQQTPKEKKIEICLSCLGKKTLSKLQRKEKRDLLRRKNAV